MEANIAFFVFVLFCLSSHACYVRPLCDLDKNVQHGTQIPNKNHDNGSRVNNNICIESHAIDIRTSKIFEAKLNDDCKVKIMYAKQAKRLNEEDLRVRVLVISVDQNDEIIISGRKLLHKLTESKDDYDYPDYPKPYPHPPQHN